LTQCEDEVLVEEVENRKCLLGSLWVITKAKDAVERQLVADAVNAAASDCVRGQEVVGHPSSAPWVRNWQRSSVNLS